MIVPPVMTLAIMCVWATHCSTTCIEVEVFIPVIQICPETTREVVPKFAVCPDTTMKDVSQSSVCLDTTKRVVPKLSVCPNMTRKVFPEFPVCPRIKAMEANPSWSPELPAQPVAPWRLPILPAPPAPHCLAPGCPPSIPVWIQAFWEGWGRTTQ